VLAVAASILTAAYHLLRHQLPYRDLGPLHFARLDQDRTAQLLARRIRELSYQVEIRKAA
jgi:transposase